MLSIDVSLCSLSDCSARVPRVAADEGMDLDDDNAGDMASEQDIYGGYEEEGDADLDSVHVYSAGNDAARDKGRKMRFKEVAEVCDYITKLSMSSSAVHTESMVLLNDVARKLETLSMNPRAPRAPPPYTGSSAGGIPQNKDPLSREQSQRPAEEAAFRSMFTQQELKTASESSSRFGHEDFGIPCDPLVVNQVGRVSTKRFRGSSGEKTTKKHVKPLCSLCKG